MADITNPHDKFFKEIFSRKEIAKGFIKEYLPAEVILRYIASGTDKIDEEGLTEVLKEIEGGEEIMPTLAERWIEKGERIGIEKEKRLLLRQIERKWGETNSWVRERLESISDPDELETIGERILICDRRVMELIYNSRLCTNGVNF